MQYHSIQSLASRFGRSIGNLLLASLFLGLLCSWPANLRLPVGCALTCSMTGEAPLIKASAGTRYPFPGARLT